MSLVFDAWGDADAKRASRSALGGVLRIAIFIQIS